VLDLLLDASEEAAATVLVSLHDVEAALGRFRRIIALRDGRTQYDGHPDGLASHDVRALFATEVEAS
jgi:phosphonate transport system ATP-binding protein